MKTRVCRLYGKNDIRIETEDVTAPGTGEVCVAIGAGGICGSDLHYYHDGGFGPIRVREPIILGHEVAGIVEIVGDGVTDVVVGDRVALNPSRPCVDCKFCAQGLFQHCLEMRFFGSAMRFPHEQGAFRDRIVTDASRCIKVASTTSLGELACSEPLAVCLHARNRAGALTGKKVLITGAGPIGSLATAVARHAGADEIVVTDIHRPPLAAASKMGATAVINVSDAPDAMNDYFADKGYFDVAFECSAAPVAVNSAISALRPQGTLVQLGVSGDLPVPINMLVGKEIHHIGSHRFHGEFAEAAKLVESREIDVRPIISDSYPVENALDAFKLASNRSGAVKIQLSFSD